MYTLKEATARFMTSRSKPCRFDYQKKRIPRDVNGKGVRDLNRLRNLYLQVQYF